MNIREIISALCPQPISFEIATYNPYDPEDVAYALAGLSELQSSLLRTKYALEIDRLPDLGIAFYLRVIDWWGDNILPMDPIGREFRRKMGNLGVLQSLRQNKDFIQSLTNLALHDHIHHHTCTVCQGRSNLVVSVETLQIPRNGVIETYHKGQTLICPECAGLGRKPQTGRERARIMKIPEATWRKNHEPVFREVSSVLDQEENDAVIIMKKRLGVY